MNKNIFLAALIIFSVKLSAQAYTNSQMQANITDSNAFLDASSNFNHSANGSHSLGKGLVFPDTDLTQFEFDMTLADGIYFPSYFDGMVVYNTGLGNTRTGGNNPTVASAVTPGFYYFSNPNGTTNGNLSGGTWKPLGGAGTTYTGSASVTLSGTSFQRAALTGDVTAAANGNATTISNGAVTSAKILDGTIANADLANNAVTSDKILDGTIATADIANNAVTTDKILDGTIGSGDIANNAVTVAKLPAGATATSFLRGDGTWASPAVAPTVRSTVAGTSLQASDHGGFVYVTNGGSITVPSTLPAGFHCVVIQQGTAQVNLTGSGVTLTTARGLRTRKQYSAIGIIKQTTAAGTVTGDAVQ